jgi:hypothetical protein
MIKETVLVRFGDSALDLLGRLDEEQDLQKLKAIHHLALSSKDLDDFRRNLKGAVGLEPKDGKLGSAGP